MAFFDLQQFRFQPSEDDSFVPHKGKQRSFADCSKVTALLVLHRIVLFYQFQRFPQLQHCRKLMFAVVTAETGADEAADLTVAVFKFHLVCLAAFIIINLPVCQTFYLVRNLLCSSAFLP